MKIKKLPKSQLEIRSTIAWDNWKKYIDQAVEKIGKDIKIPGFRSGKAPREVLEKKVGTIAILEEAGGIAIQKDYIQILEEKKLDVIGRPQAEFLKLAEGNDLEYKIITDVMPEVKIDKWEDGIKRINKEFNKQEIKISEEEIQKELEYLASSRAALVTVKREARQGDNVVLDFQVFQDNIPIENGSSKNHPIILGKGVFIPGFEENIIGMKENEEKTFELIFPENYHEKSLAGKPATFKVKVNLVQERQIPKINDEFAKSLGNFSNLEALKKSITSGIEEEKRQQAKEKRRADFIEELIIKSDFEIPESLAHEEIHKMIQEFSTQVESLGMKLEDYLGKMQKTVKDLEKDWRPQAEKRVKAAIILEKLAKMYEIKIPNEEIETEMNKILQYYKSVKDLEKNIDLGKLYNYTKGVLINEEVFKLLEKF